MQDKSSLVRKRLKLTQAELASILGVHPLTVSKWERGILEVSPYRMALLDACDKAVSKDENIGPLVRRMAVIDGPIRALYEILKIAFK